MARCAARSAAFYRTNALKIWRLAAIGIVALALSPTTFLRDPPAGGDLSDFRAQALEVPQPHDWPEELRLEAAWELTSDNRRFGGFSALGRDADGSLLVWSDRGDLIGLSDPDAAPMTARFLSLPPAREFAYHQDIEAAWRDPATGNVWLSHENPNAIRRLSPGGEQQIVPLDVLGNNRVNLGLEAMVRLQDGRFVALSEKGDTALIFAGDPVKSPAPQIVRLATPQGWQPSDMALLPDGRALVLLRKVEREWPPFRSMLAIMEMGEIRANEVWAMTPLAILATHPLVENYEGLAVAPRADGSLTLYLVSDDNFSALQRSLLLKLHWQPQTTTARKAEARAPQLSGREPAN